MKKQQNRQQGVKREKSTSPEVEPAKRSRITPEQPTVSELKVQPPPPFGVVWRGLVKRGSIV